MEQTLAEKSYDYIRRKLSDGKLPPGKRLVNRTLASEIGVSVIPVREAIHRLASEGLIDHVPGAGAFVRNPSRQDLDNLYVLRDALESCAAAEAARYISENQLEELQYLLEQARETLLQIQRQPKGYSTKGQLNRWLDVEEQFHDLLVEASRNPLLAKVIDDNLAISLVFEAQRNDPRMLTAEVAEQTCASKSDLLNALRERNPDEAHRLMSHQIQRGRRMVVGYLNSQKRNRR